MKNSVYIAVWAPKEKIYNLKEDLCLHLGKLFPHDSIRAVRDSSADDAISVNGLSHGGIPTSLVFLVDSNFSAYDSKQVDFNDHPPEYLLLSTSDLKEYINSFDNVDAVVAAAGDVDTDVEYLNTEDVGASYFNESISVDDYVGTKSPSITTFLDIDGDVQKSEEKVDIGTLVIDAINNESLRGPQGQTFSKMDYLNR